MSDIVRTLCATETRSAFGEPKEIEFLRAVEINSGSSGSVGGGGGCLLVVRLAVSQYWISLGLLLLVHC